MIIFSILMLLCSNPEPIKEDPIPILKEVGLENVENQIKTWINSHPSRDIMIEANIDRYLPQYRVFIVEDEDNKVKIGRGFGKTLKEAFENALKNLKEVKQ